MENSQNLSQSNNENNAVIGNTSTSTEGVNVQPHKKRQLRSGSGSTRKRPEKTIFNNESLLKRQLKDVTSSEIKNVLDKLTSVYEIRIEEEKRLEAEQKRHEQQARQLLENAKSMGLPLDVLIQQAKNT